MTNSTYCRQPQHVENLPHLFEPFLLQGFSPISEHGGLLNGAYSMGPTPRILILLIKNKKKMNMHFLTYSLSWSEGYTN